MRRSIPTICGLALTVCLLFTGSTPLSAQGGPNKQPAPSIQAASTDAARTTLFISGANFSSTVSVYLGSLQLGGILIGGQGTQLIASLPPSVAVGSYRLVVMQASGSATFDVAIGANGATGATGATGPTGPAGNDGLMGPEGPMGQVGPVGPQGDPGPMGPQGAQGISGPAGPQGANGPAGPAGPQGPMGAQGVAGPVGPEGPAGVVTSGFASSNGPSPVPTGANAATDAEFLGGVVTVTITAGQKIFVTSTATLGALATPATSLRLWICQKAQAATDLTTVGFGSFDLTAAANTRSHYSLSAVITGLPAGTYGVGICGFTAEGTIHWNNNEFGYTTALVLQ